MNIVRSKKLFFVLFVMFSTLIVGLSYGTFIVNTDKYNASELLVSNLLYGIDLKNTDGSKIDGKVVTTNEVKTILVTITSLNPVDSNYSLEYKITSGNGRVYYSETTGWMPNGSISKDGGIVYVKTVKVVLVPTSNMTVDFNVNGGYSYNSELLAMSGYTKITEEYKDTTNIDNEEPLVDIVRKNNNCTITPCEYGGESKKNYLQYPTDTSSVTSNIWRITGNISSGIKAVSNITGTTTQSSIVSSLNTFYGTLPNTEEYILKTNNFNCTDSGCSISSKFSNIGLISTYEYNRVGGSSSYLANSNNFFSLNNDSIENITLNGTEQTTGSTSSGLRPTVYLKEDVNVTGSGTANDPYRIYSVGKVITIKYTKNGTPVTELPSKEEYIVSSVTCTGGRVGRWDEVNSTVVLTKGSAPTTCIVDFKAGYTVTMKSDDATIGTPSSKVVGRIGSTSFTFSTTEAYDLSKSSVSCVGGASGSVSGNTINITNVTAVNTCTLTIPKKMYAVTVTSNDISMGTVTVDKTSVEHGGNVIITLSPKLGYEYGSDDCGGTKSGNIIAITNITSTKSCTVVFDIDGSTLAGKLRKTYPSSGERTNFSTIYTETKLHTAEDYDGNTTYYFTGNPNNWVSFAGKLWRVIRINGDGSVRLLYAGTGAKDGYIASNVKFNNEMTSPAHVGWKYTLGSPDTLSIARENGTPSTIYTYIKTNWYDKLTTDQKSYINTNAVYCNDRNTSYSGTVSNVNFPGYKRLYIDTIKTPTYTCNNSDIFKDGFGLMTADEVVFAGGSWSRENRLVYYYLNVNSGCSYGVYNSWLMTPSRFVDGQARIHIVLGEGSGGTLLDAGAREGEVYRPVISLKSCVTVAPDGDGSGTNPYVVNGTC